MRLFRIVSCKRMRYLYLFTGTETTILPYVANDSNLFTSSENFLRAVRMGSEDVMSTPAFFNRSMGYLEPPDPRKFL